MSEAERPKSSWQSWVRSAERERPAPGPAVAGAEEDLDVVLRWGEAGEEQGQPSDLSADPAAADALAELEEVAYDEAGDEVEADDVGWMDVDDADLDGLGDEGEFGELLPSVPLLPSIAGRVEALGGVLRSIAHRVDGLNAATDVYRSTIVDRIDEFTETVLEQGRRADQSLDEYRRTTERTISELRRRIAEQGELAGRLLARVEEVATDVGSIVAGGPVAGSPAAGSGTDHQALDHLRTLLEVVVDTMPASAEGSGADVGAALTALSAKIDGLEERLPVGAARDAAPGLDPATISEVADAVVARLDLDALATLVAEHLGARFEVVDEVPAAEGAAPAPPDPRPKGRRRR